MAPTGIMHKATMVRGQKGVIADWNDDHEITGNVDMIKKQFLNNVIENRTDFPAGPVAGQVVYRTDYPNGFIWNGTAWRSLTPAQLIVVASDGTGDYLTIQEGINALPASGGLVHVKTGTYTITATITIPNDFVTLQGDGEGTAIVSTTQDLTFIEVNGLTGIRIRDLYLFGDSVAKNQIGIEYLNSDSGSIENILIGEFGGAGIYMEGSDGNIVRDCVINDCFNFGLWMIDCDGNSIINNRILSTATDVFGYGFYLSNSHKNMINENLVYGCEEHGVWFNACTYNNFGGNMVRNNSFGHVNTSSGIVLIATSTHNTIVGNKSHDDQGVHTQKWGIIEAAVGDNYNIITNNVCVDNQTAEIVSNGPNSVVANNITGP